ncbi:MAG TPA: 2'-5' RNA ligase family protein [Pseudomonadales bacterium]|nr:2'-5' RNA ligase family protein [Pseudomonadales bacterium]
MKNSTRFSISRRALLQNISLLCGAALLPARASSIENTQPAFIYAMALVPPPDISAACAAIRKQFDPSRSNKTFPHITLKQPLTMMGNQKTAEQALLQATKNICMQHHPLQIALEKVDRFDSPTHGTVVHVRVTLSPELRQLQQKLVQAISAIGGITEHLTVAQEIQTYYPHLTLAQGLSHEAATLAMASNTGAVTQKQFTADSIVVGRCGADQVWKKIGVFALSGHS